MSIPAETPRQRYQAWIEEQLEDYKAGLTRDELLDLAEVAVQQLFDAAEPPSLPPVASCVSE